jgi:hypothetical protein
MALGNFVGRHGKGACSLYQLSLLDFMPRHNALVDSNLDLG